MEKLFVPYELAVKLKELGFDENCFAYWRSANNLQLIGVEYLIGNQVMSRPSYIKAPTWEQAFDWFRVNHGLYGDIYRNSTKYLFTIEDMILGNSIDSISTPIEDYEEARLQCLIKLIENYVNSHHSTS